jgi:hypothetical protein
MAPRWVMTSSKETIAPPHKSEHPSHWYYRQPRRQPSSYSPPWEPQIVFIPDVIKIRSAVLKLYAYKTSGNDVIFDDNVSAEDHGKWRHHRWSSSHLTKLRIRRVVITDCRKLKGTSLDQPPMALSRYQMSRKSDQPFSSYMAEGIVRMTTDRWQHDLGWKTRETRQTECIVPIRCYSLIMQRKEHINVNNNNSVPLNRKSLHNRRSILKLRWDKW